MSESKASKTRKCKTCKADLVTTAEGIKKHSLICAFEQRTGLVIVQNDDGLQVLEG